MEITITVPDELAQVVRGVMAAEAKRDAAWCRKYVMHERSADRRPGFIARAEAMESVLAQLGGDVS